MTVQELIIALQEVEDKTLPVTMNVSNDYNSVSNVEVDDFCEATEYGWINNNLRGNRKVILLME